MNAFVLNYSYGGFVQVCWCGVGQESMLLDSMYMCIQVLYLTHWGWVTHMCAGKLTITDSDNGLSPGWRQVINRTNAGILLIRPLGTNVSEILIQIQKLSFKKMYLKMLSAKWHPFCPSLSVLTHWGLWHMYVKLNWVIIGSGNTLLIIAWVIKFMVWHLMNLIMI